ncbi:tetratricopeptide repeat protein [Viscerimonas tarda]
MKRIVSMAILCMLVSMTFAQKKVVKETKKLIDDKKFGDARQMIKPALTDPETANDPDTWKTAGDIEEKAFSAESAKEMLRQAFNEDVMYPALYNEWEPYIKADSLSRIPNQKGKIDEKYRTNITAIMKANHMYYINGGVYYNKKKDYKKAADFFERYWELPSLKMFEGSNITFNTADTISQLVKYYAAICTVQLKDHDRAIRLLRRIIDEPFIENNDYQKSEVYELLSNEYIQINDSATYIEILKEGSKLYPKSKYFVPNLINEMIKREKMDEALIYLDQAIANDPESACELYSVKASIYTQDSKFDESFSSYEKALAVDGNCEKALEGLAVAYIVKAQDLREKATQETSSRKVQTEIDNQANELYKKAYPPLEKLRSIIESRIKSDDPESKSVNTPVLKSVLYKLRNAYYNLNMNTEYDAVTKAYEDLSNE